MTTQSETIRCSQTVKWDVFYPTLCRRKGVAEEDGKWWCRQHLPSNVRARHEAASARYKQEGDTKRAEWAREAAVMRACEGIDTDDLKPGMILELQGQREKLALALDDLLVTSQRGTSEYLAGVRMLQENYSEVEVK